MLTQQFRKAVYQSFCKRADAMMDFVDALTVAGHVISPVALSEETPFRRKFSSIFDTLLHGEIDFDLLLPALMEYQPGDSELIAGYELHALDCTLNERDEAETLEDRGSLKTEKDEPVRYGPPAPRTKGKKGAPAKHGAKFKLSNPSWLPDRTETFSLGEQSVSLQAWQGLHFKKLAALVGMLVRVEFLRPDGTPRYKRPMWLFWIGPETVALSEICRMYLWRFAIEHFFRFMKQHLGLKANQSTDLVSTD